MSYASQTAAETAQPFFFLRIEGIPSFGANGDTAVNPAQLALATHIPDYDADGDFVRALDLDAMGGTGQRINLDTFATDMAAVEFGLVDVNLNRLGQATDTLTALFSTVAPVVSRLGQATLNATDTTFSVTTTTGLAAGDVVYLGRESMRIAAGGIGVGAITVEARGMFGSSAAVHEQTNATTGAAHADGIYLAPPFWRGRTVALYANYVGETAGSETIIDDYILDRIAESSRGTGYAIHCRDNMRRLARSVNRQQFGGRVISDGRPLRVAIAGANVPSPATIGGASHIRVGDTRLLLAQTFRGADVVEFDFIPTSGGILIPLGLVGQPALEVYPTDPAAVDASGTSVAWFAPIPNGGSATPTANPVRILLCLMLSTGAGTNVTAGQTNYDVLPARMGLAIPVANVDIAAFETLAADAAIADLVYPSLVFGADGKPINVRAWAEEHIMRPAGAAFVVLSSGLVSVARIGVFYPLQATATTLGTDDYYEGDAVATLGEEQVLAGVHIRYGPDGADRIYVTAPERLEQYPDDTREIDFTVDGSIGSSGLAALVDRAVLRIADSPAWRRWRSRLMWNKHQTDVGSYITLTDTSVPNTSGTRGVAAQTVQITAKSYRFAEAAVEVDALMAPVRNVGHVSPSLRCNAAAAGTVTLTCTANEYTDTLPGDAAMHPTPDVNAFADLVGARLMLTTRPGARRDDNSPTVVSINAGANQITISTAFESGGVDIAINVDDVIEFEPYGASTTTQQKKYVAVSDVGGLPGATSDPAYVYGA